MPGRKIIYHEELLRLWRAKDCLKAASENIDPACNDVQISNYKTFVIFMRYFYDVCTK